LLYRQATEAVLHLLTYSGRQIGDCFLDFVHSHSPRGGRLNTLYYNIDKSKR
jgi:hypothetical protein